MPLTSKGNKIMENMKSEYGPKKGESVFYASKNKGTISGVDASAQERDEAKNELIHLREKLTKAQFSERQAIQNQIDRINTWLKEHSSDELPEEGVFPATSAHDAAPFRFACDSIPDCQARIVKAIGTHVLLLGMAQDSGAWFTRGPEGFRRHGSKTEALAHIEYAMDAVENVEGSKESKELKDNDDWPAARQQTDAEVEQIHGGKIVAKGNKFEATDVSGISTTHDNRRDAVEALAKRAKQGAHDADPRAPRSVQIEGLKAEARRIADEIDRHINQGARITLTDPLSIRLKQVRQKIARLKSGQDAELFPGSSNPDPERAKLFQRLSGHAEKKAEQERKKEPAYPGYYSGLSRAGLEGMDIEKATVSYAKPKQPEPLTAAEKANMRKEGGALPKDGFDWVGAANGDANII